jgi:hypothetical protein
LRLQNNHEPLPRTVVGKLDKKALLVEEGITKPVTG